jgi:effector-binding domain-containing protein
MSERFRIKTLTPQPFVAIRAATTPGELPHTLAEGFGEVWRWLNQLESVTVGPPIARYQRFSAEAIDVECGFPVAAPLTGDARVRCVELHGGRAATVLHHGPYDGLPAAWQELRAWLEAQRLESAGPPWEIYWVDPQTAKDPSEIRTELVWPIATPERVA